MASRHYLLLSGCIFALLALLGVIGVLGPTEADSVLGAAWWANGAENWMHIIAAGFALLAYALLPVWLQRPLVFLAGVCLLFLAGWGMARGALAGMLLQHPAETVLHGVLGIWGLAASIFGSRRVHV